MKRKNIIIDFKNNKIFSTQKYRGSDPDVSDIAMDFYSVIYGLDQEFVVNRKLKDTEFCGDTMTSYKTIISKYVNEKTNDDWNGVSHCLSNFWLLPMDVGHSSSWTGRRGLMHLSKSAKCKDEMGRFIRFYINNYCKYKNAFGKYAEVFTAESFEDSHYLKGIEYDNLSSVPDFRGTLKERADKIAKKKEHELKRMFEQAEYEVRQ